MRERSLAAFVFALSLPLLPAAQPARAAEDPASAREFEIERRALESAPVVFDGRELFRVRGTSALPARDRADAISERIRRIARDRSVSAEAVTAVPGEEFIEITAGPRLVMTVTEADAEVENVDRTILSRMVIVRVRGAIETYRADRGRPALVRGVAVSLGAFVALVVLLWLLRRPFDRFQEHLDRRYGTRVRSLRLRSLPFLHAEQAWTILQRSLRTLRLVLGALALAFFLEVVLGSFPWTRPIARDLLSYVTNPIGTIALALLAYIPKLAFLLVLGVVTWWALRILKLFFSGIETGTIEFPSFYPEWALPTYRLVRIFVLAFAVVVAYPYLPGSGSAAFKGVSLFLGVMLSLGSSSAISNLIAGYSMTYRRAFRIGDRIRIGDHTGDVEKTRLLVTHLRTVKNEEVVLPNSLILGSAIVNYSSLSQEDGLILHTSVGIGYEVPWRQVEAMLIAAAERTTGLRAEPPPFVLQKSLGDFAVNYELNVFTGEPRKMARTYTDLHRNIQDVFNEHGVQIMTPAYEGDPDEPKIVPVDRWYAPPARNPGAEGDGPGEFRVPPGGPRGEEREP